MLKYSSLAHLINMYLINNFKKEYALLLYVLYKTKLEVNVIYLLQQHQPNKLNERKKKIKHPSQSNKLSKLLN